jgi:serpin B
MKATLFTAILISATLISCEKNTTEPPRVFQEIVINKTTADIIQSDNEFGLVLFREVVSADPESDNIFVSPTSIALALAMTYNGAAGETKTAMETALRKVGFTVEEINTSYKSLIDALVSVDPKVLLEIANSIWYREGFTVLQEFVTTNQQYYDAQVSSLDFNDAGAPGIINNWVSDKTHDKIKKIVEEINPQTVMYLINAIYFKGMWQTEFKKENTSDGPFYLNSGSPVTVPLMKQTTALRYTANEVFSMTELPYGQGNFSMLVMLPQSGLSTDDIVSTLTPENWDTWMGELTERNVDLELPKFTFEYKNELKNELEAMGMGIAFSDGQADFSKIYGAGGLFISKVLHKSFVEVNEEGTEAAAVTSVEIELTSVGPEPQVTEFHVDHPFLFAIREKSTGTILFIGRVNNPLTKANG